MAVYDERLVSRFDLLAEPDPETPTHSFLKGPFLTPYGNPRSFSDIVPLMTHLRYVQDVITAPRRAGHAHG